jgi:hypothetical protein
MLRVAGVVVFVSAALLLTSVGGIGIVVSPITLPLMYALVRMHPTRPFRVAGVVIGGLTALEGGWGLGFVLFGRDTPATLATVVGVAAVAVVLFARVGTGTSRLSAPSVA